MSDVAWLVIVIIVCIILFAVYLFVLRPTGIARLPERVFITSPNETIEVDVPRNNAMSFTNDELLGACKRYVSNYKPELFRLTNGRPTQSTKIRGGNLYEPLSENDSVNVLYHSLYGLNELYKQFGITGGVKPNEIMSSVKSMYGKYEVIFVLMNNTLIKIEDAYGVLRTAYKLDEKNVLSFILAFCGIPKTILSLTDSLYDACVQSIRGIAMSKIPVVPLTKLVSLLPTLPVKLMSSLKDLTDPKPKLSDNYIMAIRELSAKVFDMMDADSPIVNNVLLVVIVISYTFADEGGNIVCGHLANAYKVLIMSAKLMLEHYLDELAADADLAPVVDLLRTFINHGSWGDVEAFRSNANKFIEDVQHIDVQMGDYKQRGKAIASVLRALIA